MRISRLVLVGLVVAGAAACKDNLGVTNPNDPDKTRALARPGDVENLVGSSYQAVHNGALGAFGAVNIQTMSLSLENFSNLANSNMGPRAAIPRAPVDNSRNNAVAGENYRDFLVLHRAARQAAVGLAAMNAATFTFFPPSAGQVARDKAMAHFAIGTALGNVALIYDQGSAISASDNLADPTPLPLVAFDSLMKYALAELDSSMHYDSVAGTAATTWSTVATLNWFGNPGLAMSRDSMVAFAQGYKARFRAGVARTPADRAAVNWTTVITDATAFLNRFPNGAIFNMLPGGGWDIGYLSTIFQSNQSNWTMMWSFILGMSDTSGNYAAWIATQNSAKAPFLVVTPDRRFPAGLTRAAQQAVGQGVMPAGVYFRNRSAPDWPGDPYSNSFYDHERWFAFVQALRIGPFPVMPATEIRMLRAEGNIRQGNFAAAATDIDVTRGPAGLTTVTSMGITTAGQALGPTATGCVPKAPTLIADGTGTVACGTIMEAMKWEKRLETQWTAPYAWYIDARGWGDLPVNTATMWPTPYQEIDTRQLFAPAPSYTSSYGGGGPNSAATNTYGLH